MRRELLRRLVKLEARRPNVHVDGLFWENPIDPERRQALDPSERIVEDWYLDSDYRIQTTIERITTDAADEGRNYRETADGQVIDSNLQREIMVEDPHLLRVCKR